MPYSMTYNPDAIQDWIDATRRFANYRNEIHDAMRWFGEEVTKRMKEGHPPGGPWPAPGAMPEPGKHAYIDRTGWLTDSIGFSLEAMPTWDLRGTAPALPTLMVFATAPHAAAIEYGVPGHSRPFPFFYFHIFELVPELTSRIDAIMARADAIRVKP